LRAPNLFFEMLEACGTRLCHLDALACVRFGIKTGANGFFYLESVPGGAPGDLGLFRNGLGEERFLERRFLRRALRSPRALRAPELLPEPWQERGSPITCERGRSGGVSTAGPACAAARGGTRFP
jgi:hypothetical protein